VVAALRRHRIFMNYAPYPAVPRGSQRFRISVMATHTREDIDALVACVADIWSTCGDGADAGDAVACTG